MTTSSTRPAKYRIAIFTQEVETGNDAGSHASPLFSESRSSMHPVTAHSAATGVVSEIAAVRHQLLGPDGGDPALSPPLGPEDDTLEMCAAAYTLPDGFREKNNAGIPLAWAWPSSTFDMTLTRREELLQAAAMIAAAIERLDRQAAARDNTARRPPLQVVPDRIGQKR